jgi:hypothetical protein
MLGFAALAELALAEIATVGRVVLLPISPSLSGIETPPLLVGNNIAPYSAPMTVTTETEKP